MFSLPRNYGLDCANDLLHIDWRVRILSFLLADCSSYSAKDLFVELFGLVLHQLLYLVELLVVLIDNFVGVREPVVGITLELVFIL